MTAIEIRHIAPEADRLLSVAEVERRLGVCHCTAYKLMNSGALPSLKVGRSRKIRLSALVAYMQHGTPAPAL